MTNAGFVQVSFGLRDRWLAQETGEHDYVFQERVGSLRFFILKEFVMDNEI
mgnify:CR=1 FL=1